MIHAYYSSFEKPSGTSHTNNTYRIWRERVGDNRRNLDENKLANVRRDIIRNNRLTEAELDEIRQNVRIEPSTPTTSDETTAKQTNSRLEDHCTTQIPPEREVHFTDIEAHNDMMDEQLTKDQFDQICQMKEQILCELTKVKNTKMEDRESLRKVNNNKHSKEQVRLGNIATRKILEDLKPNLTQLNEIIYASAKVLENICIKDTKQRNRNHNKKPGWKLRIEREIEIIRGEISIMEEFTRSENIKKFKSRKARKVKKEYKLKP